MKKLTLVTLMIFGLSSMAFAVNASMCPVMTDKVGKEKNTVEYQGKKYLLCCKSCIKKFNANPEKYADK